MTDVPLEKYIDTLLAEERRHTAAQLEASQRALDAASQALQAQLASMDIKALTDRVERLET